VLVHIVEIFLDNLGPTPGTRMSDLGVLPVSHVLGYESIEFIQSLAAKLMCYFIVTVLGPLAVDLPDVETSLVVGINLRFSLSSDFFDGLLVRDNPLYVVHQGFLASAGGN